VWKLNLGLITNEDPSEKWMEALRKILTLLPPDKHSVNHYAV